MAGIYNIEINQGEDFIQYFKWTLTDGVTPVPLTGFSWSAQIRSTANSSSILAELTVTTVSATEGIFTLSLSAALTAELPTSGERYSDVSEYVYDVIATSAAGTVYKVIKGSVLVSPGVTK